ncbi:phosphotransferase family protein [Nocardioides dubius]|uniref:Phosphotransferase family protein n=1 Tax=Nocardioides dubius TaxID=317019 RepID=A0ABP4EC21_9ACTN
MNDLPTAGSADQLALPALQDYLHATLQEQGHAGLAGDLDASLIAGGRSNPTYLLSDGTHDWVLRRPPYGQVWANAHDVGREARVVSALRDTPVPVPNVVAHCTDEDVLGAPFYVMDRIPGRTFRTHQDTAELSVEQRAALAEAMVETLVHLHEIDPAAVGLENLGRPDGYLKRQLDRWARQWDVVKTAPNDGVSDLLRLLYDGLPETRHTGIVHGDYKIDNVMVDPDAPGRILGVLDWEMATVGDTIADLGFLVSFWDEPGQPWNPISAGATAHEGFSTASHVVERYAERRGIDVEGIEWYLAFSDFKLAVILEQIHHRHLKGETTGEGFDDIGAMVAPLLSRALLRAG